MPTQPPTQEEIDNQLAHTAKIQLLSGKELIYRLTPQQKEDIEGRMMRYTDEVEPPPFRRFLNFSSISERSIFVNISHLKKLIIQFDNPQLVVSPYGYTDPLNAAVKDHGKTFIPDAIILFKGKDTAESYTIDLVNDGINFDGADELEGIQFIRIMDEDGENNFIPVDNIQVLDITSRAVYPMLYEDEEDETF